MIHHPRRSLLLLAALSAVASLLAVSPAGAQDVPTCNGVPATIVGTEGNDRISGTPGNDVIVGLGGRDRIAGGAGRDLICGGDGIDIIKGGKGRDTIFGDAGNDRLFGNVGQDTIDGGTGRDKTFGGAGNDVVIGGRGNDNVSGGSGIDTCDLDRNDRFGACELGDVVGVSGSADAEFTVSLDSSHAAHIASSFNGPVEFHVMEFVLDGPTDADPLSIAVYDADDTILEFYTENADTYTGEVIVRGRPARVEVAASDGAWEIVFKRPEILARTGRIVGNDSSRVFILADPVGANETAVLRLSPETRGNVIVQAWAGDRLPDLFVNEVYPHPDGFDTWTGTARPGTRLVAVEVDFGQWTFEVGPTG